MNRQTRMALLAVGGSLLLFLPLVAYLYFFGPDTYQPPRRGQISQLIADGNYAQAYQQLNRTQADSITSEESTQRQLQMALCELNLGKPEQAHTRLRDLPMPPPLLESYRQFWMAQALEDMEQVEAAVTHYRHFLTQNSQSILAGSARQRLAALHMESDNHQAAIELYEELMEEPALAPRSIYSIALAHLEAGQKDVAYRQYVQLMEEYPKDKRALRAAIDIEGPLNAKAAFAVASTYHAHKRYADSKKRFQQFIKRFPHDQRVADAYYNLALSQLGLGQYETAIRTFEKTYEQYGLPSALYRIGGVYITRNNEADAIAIYERFSRQYPQHNLADDALWQAAKSAERNNRFSEAERLYKLLVSRHPQSTYRDDAGWGIGFTFYCRSEFDKALQVFERLSNIAQQPHVVDQSLYWAGKAAAELGRSVESQSYYNRAADGFPRSYYSTRAVKMGYGQLGALERVGAPERSLLSIEDIKGADHLARSDALFSLGLHQQARREIGRAEKLNESSVERLELIRDRYEALGFLSRALRLSMRIFVANDKRSDWERVYPNYYWEEIVTAATEAKVDPYLVLSVIRQESTFNEGATSRAGARGLMQIMPKTGKKLAAHIGMHRFKHSSLYDPDVSIRLGSYFLGDQVRQFTNGTTADMGFELGLAAYNAGPHNARQWLERFPHNDADAFIERIPFKETRLYVKLVLKNYAIYKALSDV